MTTQNPVRRALLERRLTIGTWMQAGHPAIAEVLSGVGFDWIAADIEHTDIDCHGFTQLARAMHGRGVVPMARVRENDTLAIRQILDAGARGVIVPLVNSASEAARAVAAAKYPPMGVRGFAFCRANDWGKGFDAYAQGANDDIAVVVMIESKQAVDHIDEILAVDGVDGVFIGPYDMSGSYGLTGQTNHPVIKDACARVAAACARAKKAAGLHVVNATPAAIGDAIGAGFTFIALGIDLLFVDSAARLALEVAESCR